MKPWHAVVSVLAFAVAALAQNQPLQPVKITPVVGEYPLHFSGWIKTDRGGNVYVQLMDGVGPSSSSRGIVKISRDGTRVTRFNTQGARDVERLMDFTPSPWGDVYMLWKCRGSLANVLGRYGPDGQLLYSNKVDPRVFAGRVAALAGGNLLLAVLKGPSREQVEPVADIVSDTGTWIASVSLQTAVPSGTNADAVQVAQHGSSPRTQQIELLTSDDGEALLTRTHPYPAVFRILSSGQVTRYDLPRPDGEIRIDTTLAAGGQMLVSYELAEQTRPNSFRVKGRVCELIDLDSGKTLKLFPTRDGRRLIAFGPNSLLYFGSIRISEEKSRFEFREFPIE